MEHSLQWHQPARTASIGDVERTLLQKGQNIVCLPTSIPVLPTAAVISNSYNRILV
jgi:hypothetical protein